MTDQAATLQSPKERARALILSLGAANVAAWCGVSVGAVYQWLSRADDADPFPVARVLPVVLGAHRAGVRIDVSALWPPFSELRL